MASFEGLVRGLVDDLRTCRVETFVVETLVVEPPRGPALRGRRPTRKSEGMPPADPVALLNEAYAVSTGVVQRHAEERLRVADSQPQDYVTAAQRLVDRSTAAALRDESTSLPYDPDTMRRMYRSLVLQAHARGEGGVGLASRSTPPRAVDHRLLREVTRYTEARDRSVWCRTTMNLDGDAATQFRFDNPEAVPINTAHRAMSLVAIDQWQLLIVILGHVVVALGGVRLRLRRPALMGLREFARDLWPRDGAPRLDPVRLANRAIQLYSVGRVVFETPAPGPDAAVRTMLLSSGDVETTIRRGVAPAVLVAHTEAVTRWLTELRDGVLWWAKAVAAWLRLAAVAVAVTTSTDGLRDAPSFSALARAAAILVTIRLATLALRIYLRWRVRQITGHSRGRVHSLPI